ncbi:MAG TPA: hypothetical protein VD995_05130 [Azospirillum sp.]|nr:hypothetical protein [Azospirillum sp.]
MSIPQIVHRWVRLAPGGEWVPAAVAKDGMYRLPGLAEPVSVSEVGPICVPPAGNSAHDLADAIAAVAHAAAAAQRARLEALLTAGLAPDSMGPAAREVTAADAGVSKAVGQLAAALEAWR